MSRREPEPAVPVLPRAADIINYNAWARRNGRPLWSGPAAPGAMAAAAEAEPVWTRGTSIRVGALHD